MCTLHINHTQNHFNSNSVLVYHISNNVVSCHRLPLRYIYTNCYVQAPPCGGGPLDNSAQHFHRTNSIFSFSSYLYGIYVVYVFLFISFLFLFALHQSQFIVCSIISYEAKSYVMSALLLTFSLILLVSSFSRSFSSTVILRNA